ncbi:MAG TPA: glycosyltransferase family 39 protein [Candidatus Eremiobacteraceae bacterium]|nr:glycosyltransferase family 39 protein [Candidatus Eremiobacteraceae bacterium]
MDPIPDEIVSSTPALAIGAHTISSGDPMERGETDRSALAPLSTAAYALAIVAFALHVGFSGRFGYFRDELYYAACGQHLAWGYVDHAPLAPLLARVSRAFLGDSLLALRFLPALAAAAKVILSGWMARELSGGKYAHFLAAFCVLLAPIYLTFDSFFSMNAFEPVFWMTCAAIVLRILNGGNPKLWILCGLIAGLGILNKHSMLFFCSGIAVGLLAASVRKHFRQPWIWLGVGIVFLCFLPNLLWEIHYGWPTLALFHAVMGTKYVTVSPWEYIWQQTLLTHPLATPIWIAGLYFLLRDPLGKKYAVLAWAYFTVLAEMLILHGKIYYLAPAYIMLLAAGSVWIELRLVPRIGAWLRPTVAVPLLIGGLIAAPLAMPILPVEATIRYTRFWDVHSIRVENVPVSELPQIFADMFGWQEQVRAVAGAYKALPDTERAQAVVLAYNYGEASAVDYFGSKLGLPRAISGHNQYGLWGPGATSGHVVVAIGFSERQLLQFYDEVTPAASVSLKYAIPEESHLTIFVCRRPHQSLQESWSQWKYLS